MRLRQRDHRVQLQMIVELAFMQPRLTEVGEAFANCAAPMVAPFPGNVVARIIREQIREVVLGALTFSPVT